MKVQFKYKSMPEKNDEVELIMTTHITVTREDIDEIAKQVYENHYEPICNESDIEELTDKISAILDERLYREMDDELAAEIMTTKLISERNLAELQRKVVMELIENEECE